MSTKNPYTTVEELPLNAGVFCTDMKEKSEKVDRVTTSWVVVFLSNGMVFNVLGEKSEIKSQIRERAVREQKEREDAEERAALREKELEATTPEIVNSDIETEAKDQVERIATEENTQAAITPTPEEKTPPSSDENTSEGVQQQEPAPIV